MASAPRPRRGVRKMSRRKAHAVPAAGRARRFAAERSAPKRQKTTDARHPGAAPCSADPQAQFGDSAVGPIADRDRSRAPESPDRDESAGGCYPHLVPMLVSVSSVMLPVYVTPVPLA
jgi:hypothetical protein